MGLPDKLDIRKEADRNWLAIHNISIFLDGEQQRDVIAFDVKAGTLVKNKRDERGNPALTKSKRLFATQTIHGKVEVRWK